MSTLSIVRTETAGAESDADSRFHARVRCPVPAQRTGGPDFETVFDLDYGQLSPEVVPVPEPSAARRIRALTPAPMLAPAPVVRLTRRGRLVLVLAFLAAAVALMVPLGGWATASLSGGTPEPVRIVEVAPGDTLYGIAGELAEPGEVRAMVHRIQKLNSLPGGQIAEGQKLAVPRG